MRVQPRQYLRVSVRLSQLMDLAARNIVDSEQRQYGPIVVSDQGEEWPLRVVRHDLTDTSLKYLGLAHSYI